MVKRLLGQTVLSLKNLPLPLFLVLCSMSTFQGIRSAHDDAPIGSEFLAKLSLDAGSRGNKIMAETNSGLKGGAGRSGKQDKNCLAV